MTRLAHEVLTTRTRGDRCPGAWRPWPAHDGMLVRLRLVGGRVASTSLQHLADVAEQHGDGRIRVTGRANLQVRGLPAAGDGLRQDVLAALEATGLLPTRSHELVRNVLVSPQSGLAGGRVDLRATAADLDRRLCADADLATLPGRFLFVLDDGRGDLLGRECDLGLVALDDRSVQLRVGDGFGPVVPLDQAPGSLVGLAHEFALRRGTGPTAPWHVVELHTPLVAISGADHRLPAPVPALAFAEVPGGRHVEVGDAGLSSRDVDDLTSGVAEVVVTPWRGILVPGGTS